MFYWSYRDTHIVLSNEEEMKLVEEVMKDPIEGLGYHTSPKVRKEVEQRIFRYLKESLYTDPEAFNRRFVFRSFYDEDAQKMFPVMLDAYGRVTRRATIGLWGETSPLDKTVEEIVYADIERVFQVTLFEHPRWPWSSPSVSGYISLPASSIEKLAGTVNNFFIASNTVTIKFTEDFVRISVLDKRGRPKKAIDSDEE